MKKRIALLLCMISCLALLAGCSLTKVNKNLNESDLTKNTETFVSQWFGYDFASTVKQYESQMTEDEVTSYKEYTKMQKKHGAFKKIEDTEYSAASDSASVKETVSTEKGSKLVFTVTYDEKGEISDWKVEEYKTIGETMGKAGLNTVMSMAIVFCVLIFISLIIACFKVIGWAQNRKNAKQVDKAKAQLASVETAPQPVEENLVDDLELVAVITAAIAAASENESTDGLVVRSIVRRY